MTDRSRVDGLRRAIIDANSVGPLDGVRVLDLSRIYAGNYLAAHLADFGADVVKVEQPGSGDALRAYRHDGHSVQWKSICRNRRSIAIDLKRPEGVDIVKKLAADADILLENFRPGELASFGIGPDVLNGINPRLVIVQISAWGAHGPYRDRLGFGTLLEAFSGFASISGFPGGTPLLPRVGLADFVCGLTGAVATLIALREAEKPGGRGQVVDLSILDSMLAMLGTEISGYSVTGCEPGPTGNRSDVAAPRNLYPTKDGRYLAIAGTKQSMAEKIFQAIARPELVEDVRFVDNQSRVRNIDALDTIIEEFTSARTLDENVVHFSAHEVTAGPVNGIADVVADRHVRERGSLLELEDVELGSLVAVAPPVRMSRSSTVLRRLAPQLGEHSAQIMREAGLSDDEIADLLKRKVVEAPPQHDDENPPGGLNKPSADYMSRRAGPDAS